MGTIPLWSAQALATELPRKDKLAGVVDALEPGGSGDPFAGLDSDQRDALVNPFRMGFSPRTVSPLGRSSAWVFQVCLLDDHDPGYYTDFWTAPGYLGYELPEALRNRLVDVTTVVTEVIRAEDVAGLSPILLATAGTAGLPAVFAARVDHPDSDQLFMAKLTVTSGKAAGRTMYIMTVADHGLVPFSERCPEMFADVEPGDEVRIDNRDYLAYLYDHRQGVAGLLPDLVGPRGIIQEHRHLAFKVLLDPADRRRPDRRGARVLRHPPRVGDLQPPRWLARHRTAHIAPAALPGVRRRARTSAGR